MKITVKLFAYFRDNRFIIEEWDIKQATTVGSIVDSLDIDREEVGVLMMNYKHTQFEVEPQEGDILAIFPVVGGG